MNDFAVIRTSLVTLRVFRDDVQLWREIAAVVYGGREQLLRRFDHLASQFTTGAEGFEFSRFLTFRETMERFAAEGVLTGWADSLLQLDVFSRCRSHNSIPPRRYWFLRGSYVPEMRAGLPTSVYCSELMRDLYVQVSESDPIRDPEGLDNAFRDYLVVQLAAVATGGPLFGPDKA